MPTYIEGMCLHDRTKSQAPCRRSHSTQLGREKPMHLLTPHVKTTSVVSPGRVVGTALMTAGNCCPIHSNDATRQIAEKKEAANGATARQKHFFSFFFFYYFFLLQTVSLQAGKTFMFLAIDSF